MARVSIVMPIYNAENYVGKAIESVINQTYSDFICICVDDGSTDGTHDVISAYRDPRIVYLRQSNQGVSGARNAGIAAADSEWVAFLDADDWWYERKLEKQLAVADKFNDVGMIGCKIRRFAGEQSWLEPRVDIIDPAQCCGKIPDFFAVYHRYMAINSSSVIIRREIFDLVGGFDNSLDYGEDVEMWCRVGGCIDVGFTNYIGSAYRIVPTSKTAVKKQREQKIIIDSGLESPGWADRFVSADRRESFESMYNYRLLWRVGQILRGGQFSAAVALLLRVKWSNVDMRELALLMPERLRRVIKA